MFEAPCPLAKAAGRVLASLAAGGALCCGAVSAAGELLRPVAEALGAETRLELAADPLVMRWRLARMDREAAFGAAAGAEPLAFNLFGDVEVRARVRSARTLESGARFLAGALDGGGHYTLFRHATGIVRGEFHSAKGVFTVRSQGPRRVLVKQLDASRLPPVCGNDGVAGRAGALAPASAGGAKRRIRARELKRRRAAALDASAATDAEEAPDEVVDVLAVYTPNAEASEGGEVQMRATIEAEVEKTNQAFVNSGLGHRRMRLAAMERVDYAPSPSDLRRDFRYLAYRKGHGSDPDGVLDEVHDLRKRHAADLVHLFVMEKSEVRCGVGSLYDLYSQEYVEQFCSDHYPMDSECIGRVQKNSLIDQVFSVSAVAEGCRSGYTFTHELGHNLGLYHDRYSKSKDNDLKLSLTDPVAFPFRPYGFGYVNQNFSRSECRYTVMAYGWQQCNDEGNPRAVRELMFSNPDAQLGSEEAGYDPAGVPGEEWTTDLDGPVNASRAIDDAWSIVANLYHSSTAWAVAPVLVRDARLREHIARILGLADGAPVTDEDLAGLRELRAPSANVADLAGLELAVNLSKLDLSGNDIADLSALSGLEALRTLDLAGNRLADLSPLAGLASLAELDLSGNGLADVSALSGLAGLRELDLAGNEVGDVSPLADLSALRTLHLDGNAVADVSPLASLERLSFLVLRRNAVSDISPLLGSGLARNGYVDLRGNPLGDGHVDHVAALRREAGAAVLFDDGGHRVALFPSAATGSVAGFVRVINHSAEAGAVSIEAVDETGERRGPATLAIGAREALHFNAGDLEQGDSARGLRGIGEGAGGWRLVLRSALDIEVLGYARTPDGFVTSLHDLAPESHGTSAVATFNPGGNRRQVSRLRLINPTAWWRQADVSAWDDAGARRTPPSGRAASSLVVRPNRTLELSAAQLEAGREADESAAEFAGLGDGAGKWRLEVHAPGQRVASLLQSPTGHLANISTRTAVSPWRVRDHLAWERGGRYRVPLFLAAASDIQGFLRLVNLHGAPVAVALRAVDGAGVAREPVALRLEGREVLHLTSTDLEDGNADKGLPGIGAGAGDWHLEASANRRFEALAYARTADGFVTSLHDVAPRAEDGSLWIPFFNPGSNRAQASRLRLVNWGETAAEATITGIDDAGDSPGSAVRVRVPGRSARDYMAWELESGEAAGLSGALGDGRGKWRLRVSSPGEISAMSLLGLPTGHVTNLSTTPRFPAE